MSLPQQFLPLDVTEASELDIAYDGSVRSKRFNDIYFCPGEGVAETEHVFIEGNGLSERWQEIALAKNPNQHFVIGELGFGTGLNFLVAANHWLQCFSTNINKSAPKPTLYYLSTEKHPLTPAALAKVYKQLAAPLLLKDALVEQYPDPIGSDYCLEFSFNDCHIVLLLLFGDSLEGLQRLEHYNAQEATAFGLKVDAWFMDGFAPSKNASMWNNTLCEQMATLSHKHSTVATFTVARNVRDALTSAGFTLKKIPGFGRKREMLTGQLATNKTKATEHAAPRAKYTNYNNCYYRDKLHHKTTTASLDNLNESSLPVVIIGAGIAGACTAYHLARMGQKVIVLDEHESIACGASGNQRAVLFARTAKQRSTLSDLHEAAFHYAVNFYSGLDDNAMTDGLGGMIKLGDTLPEHLLKQNLKSRQLLSQPQASAIAGAALSKGGIFYPQSGYLKPRDICRRLLSHENIEVITNCKVNSLTQQHHSWLLATTMAATMANAHKKTLSAATVVLCGGHLTNQLSVSQWLPIKPIRGQTTQLPASEESAKLQTTICDKGYIIPLGEHSTHSGKALHHEIGASFNLGEDSIAVSATDHTVNIENALACFKVDPQWLVEDDAKTLQGRVGFRATSPDYLPMSGPLSDPATFFSQFQSLANDAKQTPHSIPSYLSGCYVNTAYGSHGFTLAPLVSFTLASQIVGRPFPVGEPLRHAVAPNRFLLRALIRGEQQRYIFNELQRPSDLQKPEELQKPGNNSTGHNLEQTS